MHRHTHTWGLSLRRHTLLVSITFVSRSGWCAQGGVYTHLLVTCLIKHNYSNQMFTGIMLQDNFRTCYNVQCNWAYFIHKAALRWVLSQT